ncbi:MAG: hypothetical protein ACFE8J_15535, partial [Candidatus Heimdallarchaeota archaeon]
ERLGKTKALLMKIFNQMKSDEKKEISKEEKYYLGFALLEASNHYEQEILVALNRSIPLNSSGIEIFQSKQEEIKRWTENQKILWTTLCQEFGINKDIHKEPEIFGLKWARSFLELPNLIDLLPVVTSEAFEKIKVPEPPELWFGDFHEILNLIGLSYDLKMISGMLSIEYQHLFYPSELVIFMKFLENKGYIKEEK